MKMKPKLNLVVLALMLTTAVAAPIETSFEGTRDPASWVQGNVGQVVDDLNFTLSDGTLIVTTGETVLDGFARVRDLVPGDLIEAEGTWSRNGDLKFIATEVTLLEPGGEPDYLLGTVWVVIDASSFVLDGLQITTDANTQFIGITQVLDLNEGDLVDVYGSWEGDIFLAEQVQMLDSADEPIEVQGSVALVYVPNNFMLENGITVFVDAYTQWTGISGIWELGVGDEVVVIGYVDPWSGEMLAEWVDVVSTNERTLISFEAFVDEVIDSDAIFLQSGELVVVGPTTLFEGFDDLTELVWGDLIWVEAYTTVESGVFDAERLALIRNAGTTVDFISVVDRVHSPDWFTTTDGYLVLVGINTEFVDMDSLDDMEPGDGVAVSGTVWDNPLEVQADLIVLSKGEDNPGDDDEDGGGLETTVTGVVTGLETPDSFVIDDWYSVRTTEHTEWRGELGGYEDLVPGLAVIVEIFFGDGLEVLSVENIGPGAAGMLVIEGLISVIEAPLAFLLESGERLLIDELTIIDGDVDRIGEIVVGMYVTAWAVDLGGGAYQVLDLFVEVSSSVVLGFEGQETDEALVVIRSGADPHEVASRHGASVSGTLPGLLVHLFQWPLPLSVKDLQVVLDDPDVEDLGPNFQFADPESTRRRFPVVDRSPDSGKFVDQPAKSLADIESAHDRSLGMGTMVAVIDTGIEPFHPLLRHRIAEGGWDYVDNDAEPWETSDGIDQDGDGDIDESAGHGTFVSGLILLAAPGTTILPYRVLDDDGHGTTFAICQAVLAAMDRGADVINLSFSYSERPRVLDRLLDEASRRGIILVSGAGNEGVSTLPFPAADHRVLAIAAIDNNGDAADFSNRGAQCVIAAPGVDLYSACSDGNFCTWSGTSMAAPLVSGAAALLRSINHQLTPLQIRDALVQSALESPPGSDLPGLLQVSAALDLVPSMP